MNRIRFKSDGPRSGRAVKAGVFVQVTVIVMSALAGCSKKETPKSVEMIIRDFEVAMFGENPDPNHLSTVTKLKLLGPERQVGWEITARAKAPNHLQKITTNAEGMPLMVETFNGETAWIDYLGKRRILEGENLTEYARMANFKRFANLKKEYASIELADSNEFEGKQYDSLKCTWPEGDSEVIHFDRETHLIAAIVGEKRTHKVLEHGHLNGRRYWKSVIGITAENKDEPVRIEVTDIQYNQDIEDSRFEFIPLELPEAQASPN